MHIDTFNQNMQEVLRISKDLDAALVDISRQILEAQSEMTAHKGITLTLANCGVEKRCLGCPHPRWEQHAYHKLRNPTPNTQRILCSHKIKHPLRTQRVMENPYLFDLITVAQNLIERRSKIIQVLVNLKRLSSNTDRMLNQLRGE